MGAPKALLDLHGIPLVLAHVRAFAAAGLRVTVVVGAHANLVSAVLPDGVRVVVNPAWETTGPAESAALGLAGLGAAVLTPVDVPPVRHADLIALMEAGVPAVLTFDGLPGHPVRLEPPHGPIRLDIRLHGALRLPSTDPGRVQNLNTPEAWAAWVRGSAVRAPVA